MLLLKESQICHCSWQLSITVPARSPFGVFSLIFIRSNSTTDSQESADTDCIGAPYSLFSLIAPVKLYCMKRHQAGLFLTWGFENWHWVLAGNELGSSYGLPRHHPKWYNSSFYTGQKPGIVPHVEANPFSAACNRKKMKPCGYWGCRET